MIMDFFVDWCWEFGDWSVNNSFPLFQYWDSTIYTYRSYHLLCKCNSYWIQKKKGLWLPTNKWAPLLEGLAFRYLAMHRRFCCDCKYTTPWQSLKISPQYYCLEQQYRATYSEISTFYYEFYSIKYDFTNLFHFTWSVVKWESTFKGQIQH